MSGPSTRVCPERRATGRGPPVVAVTRYGFNGLAFVPAGPESVPRPLNFGI